MSESKCSNCHEDFEFPIYRKRRVIIRLSPPYTEESIPEETFRKGKIEDVYVPCCPWCRDPLYLEEDDLVEVKL